ncbi:MAG: ROK family protein [Clostridia bacterium]|nr:ROK family protein [Clostridia bacterium]
MNRKYITQDKLKKKNLADIFIYILSKKQTTRREIEYETGFSWGMVSSNVAYLLEKEYITEEKSEKSGTAGRITYILKPCGERVVSIGIDINRSGLTCEIVGLDSVVKEHFEKVFTAKTQAEVIGQAEELCRTAVAWCEEHGLRVFSLGISIQGVVNGRLGTAIRFPGIPNWEPYDLKEHFARRFGLHVYLGHDPKCMLLGEMWNNACANCVLVRIDEGIGMALSLDGKILDDTEKFELGHTIAVPDGKPCSCGRRGCLEAYASVRAVAENTGVPVSELFASPQKYAQALETAGGYLGIALYNMCMLFNPQKLILTGCGVSLEALMRPALHAAAHFGVNVTSNPTISAAYGAAVESMKSAINNLNI